MTASYPTFSQTLLAWFDTHGRKDLPWQHPRSAYRVWISEIMLQQTQVKTVIPYFTRFIQRFPDVATLALASEDEVLAHWSGLGYYSRARNLHQSARILHTRYNGIFPEELDELKSLPGIGDSTAAAIASQAFNQPTAILDGNVRRVLSRYFLVAGSPAQAQVKNKLWELATACMPQQHCADYTQAIMDMGATCCTSRKPLCVTCPLQTTCGAFQNNAVDEYPGKKPKKILPVKQQQFLLLHNQQNSIYLEKRPPTGLWGGLWCLPGIDMDSCPSSYVRDTLKMKTEDAQELMRLKHSFSHYHLHIQALSLHSTVLGDTVSECTGRWFSADETKHLGLAKPVSVIIQKFLTRQLESVDISS